MHFTPLSIIRLLQLMTAATGVGEWPAPDAPAASAALLIGAGLRVRRRHAAHRRAGQPRGSLPGGPPRQPPPHTLCGQVRSRDLSQGLGRYCRNLQIRLTVAISKVF